MSTVKTQILTNAVEVQMTATSVQSVLTLMVVSTALAIPDSSGMESIAVSSYFS